MAKAIQVIRSLQVDYGAEDNAILAAIVDYIDTHCDHEDFENFMLDWVSPDYDPAEDDEHTE